MWLRIATTWLALCATLILDIPTAGATEGLSPFAKVGGWTIQRRKPDSGGGECNASFSDAQNFLLIKTSPASPKMLVAFSTHEVAEATLGEKMSLRAIFLADDNDAEAQIATGPGFVTDDRSSKGLQGIWLLPDQPGKFLDYVATSVLVGFIKIPSIQLTAIKYDSGAEMIAALRKCEASLRE